MLEEDAQGGERVEVVEGDVQEDVLEEYDEGAIVDGLVDGDIGADIPLLDMTGGDGERKKLIAEVRTRMSVDVKKLCSQCVFCQKASRADVGKGPLAPTEEREDGT